MTLLDCVNRVKRSAHRGDQAVTTDAITQDIVDCMNDARRDIIRKLPKHWLIVYATPIPTVVDQVIYSLEQPLQEPLYFIYTFQNVTYNLQKIESEREFYQTMYSPTVSAQLPRFYVELGPDPSTGNRRIQIFPKPDQVYTINYAYYKDPTQADIVTTNLNIQVPDIPIYLHDVLWKGTLYYFLKKFDDMPGQQRAELDYTEAIMQADTSENMEADAEMAFRYGNRQSWYDPTTRFRLY